MNSKLFLAIIFCLMVLTGYTHPFITTVCATDASPPSIPLQRYGNWTYGGSNFDFGNSMIETPDGGYIIAGSTNSFGAGSNDFWVIKLNQYGLLEWNKTYGGSSLDYGRFIIPTSDGGYLVIGEAMNLATGFYDILLIKLDETGIHLWNRTYGGSGYESVQGFIKTSDGGYVFVGTTASFGAGDYDAWLVKVSTNGSMVWNQTYGGANSDYPEAVVQTVDGGYAIVGETSSYGAGYNDVWLVKVDQNGIEQWSQTYGGANGDNGYDVVLAQDGGIVVTGVTASVGTGNYEVWLFKVNSTGTVEWSQTYQGDGWEFARGLTKTPDDGYVIVGSTPSIGAGGDDVWLLKVDRNGSLIWNKTYGGIGNDVAFFVLALSKGGYAILGTTTSYGTGGDIWLIATDENGETTTYYAVTFSLPFLKEGINWSVTLNGALKSTVEGNLTFTVPYGIHPYTLAITTDGIPMTILQEQLFAFYNQTITINATFPSLSIPPIQRTTVVVPTPSPTPSPTMTATPTPQPTATPEPAAKSNSGYDPVILTAIIIVIGLVVLGVLLLVSRRKLQP